MKVWRIVAVTTLALGVAAAVPAASSSAASTSGARRSATGWEQYGRTTYCQRVASLCAEPVNPIGPNGSYTGHDEPAVNFSSTVPGSGNDFTYQIVLPKNPPVRPRQDGSGGVWDFQNRATFWLSATLCDSESAPEYTKVCTPNSDVNARFTSTNPNSPAYLGRHPGNALLELQFYGPGWVPQFEGFGCTATQWCANMTIDSLSLDQNTGVANNAACNNFILGGIEPVQWAFVTKSGRSQSPANPIDTTLHARQALFPDPAKVLLMNPGDTIRVHLHDTSAGFRTDLTDLTTGGSGSMTASIANGFGHLLYQPNSTTCTMEPYAFHSMYNTAVKRGATWTAHAINVAYSDEIGHFELCDTVNSDFECTAAGPSDPTLDSDDVGCLPGSDSSLIRINGCTGSELDFDGQSYGRNWPGTFTDPARDRRFHPTPVIFTSPTTRGRQFDRVELQTDLPRIERDAAQHCDATTGANCTNPPVGAAFYPFFSTTHTGPGACAWQEGGANIPGTVNSFGGTSRTAFGGLQALTYPNTGFTTVTLFENFNRDLGGNPCKTQ